VIARFSHQSHRIEWPSFCATTGLPIPEQEQKGRIKVPRHIDPPANMLAG
jgi:hypothetical protein